ncbi:MAG: MATE family efflux transporter [Bacteroidetes bacterium]|nr:MAG: MATE family efflux transporter [Bacteroidota bacterium]
MTNKKDLTQGSIVKKLVQLSLPMMLGIISMVAFNLIDTFYVGQLGKKELAALSFTFPVIMIIFSFIQGLGIGATALIAKSIGRKEHDKAARETTDSITLTLLITGFFVIIGLLTLKPTFSLLGADAETAILVEEYMQIWYVALFFVSAPYVGNSAIRATGDARTPALIMLFAVIINAVLDPILIFGYLGAPAMGLKGAAIATAISRALTMVLAFYVLIRREKLIIFDIPTWAVLRGCWKSILNIAVPSGLARLVVPITTGVITSIMASYGDYAVAAFGVGSRIEFLASSILFALAASIGPFVGQNFGSQKLDRVKEAVRISVRFAFFWGLFAWGILSLFARQVASIFNDNVQVLDAVQSYLWIVPAGYGLQGVLGIINSHLNTVNKPLPASLIIVIQMLVIGIPIIFLGNRLAGIEGVFIALAITYIAGGLMSLLVNKQMMKKFV